MDGKYIWGPLWGFWMGNVLVVLSRIGGGRDRAGSWGLGMYADKVFCNHPEQEHILLGWGERGWCPDLEGIDSDSG